MTQSNTAKATDSVRVERLTEFKSADLNDLCDAMEEAIRDGIGFNWLMPPGREVLESYWKGVLVVPERILFAARLDGTLAGAAQLVKPTPSKQTQSFAAALDAHFVAPWARGHGAAKALLHEVEREARKQGYTILNLQVRETQEAAIKLYEENGFTRWGVHPYYEFVNGRMLSGQYFYKKLEPITNLV